jgi:2,4-dienoyl-CoA reductase (NADPH2)
MVNPRCGHEGEITLVSRSERPKKVLVIGGGPAGLTAAKTAALSGHKVTLYERTNHLGGQLCLAGSLEEKSEFRMFIDALSKQAVNAGVKIKTDIMADSLLIKKDNPEAVIIATGGAPVLPDIPGNDQEHVIQAWDVLNGRLVPGKEVVIIGGGSVGVDIALFLAKIGTLDAKTFQFLFLSRAEDAETLRELSTKGLKKITIMEMLPKIASDMGLSTRWVALQMLRRYGIDIKTNTKAEQVTPEGVIVSHKGATELLRCQSVIIAVGTQSVRPEGTLEGFSGEVIVIGDAKSPRKAFDAIREGFHAGRNL